MASTIQTSLAEGTSGYEPAPLLSIIFESLVLHQAVFAVSELGVPDLLVAGPKSSAELATQLRVDESSLYRLLRLLASQKIFAETAPGIFANTAISNCLRSDGTISFRAMARFRGTDFVYQSFGEILHCLRTGETGRHKALGMDGWEYLQKNPEMARIFDDAMTSVSSFAAPAIADSYDFGQWESIMDVGGGNGLLLAAILRAHPRLRGVLSDQQHVLERAKQRGFLRGELEERATMGVCDLFANIPSGCRAYLMKSVIHDWNDQDSLRILRNCRMAVPKGGALLLVEHDLPQDNSPARGQFIDVTMMVLTGGKERTVAEYRSLLESAGFRLTHSLPTSSGFNVIEALPV
jgi:O-methyltransferase/methyltransferase family protein